MSSAPALGSDVKTMRAAVLTAPPEGSADVKAVVVRSIPMARFGSLKGVPGVAQSGEFGTDIRREMIIRIEAAALNRRDDFCRRGMYPGPLPEGQQLGADCCGTVTAVSHAALDGGWIGTRVIVNPSMHWGHDENGHSAQFRVLGQFPYAGTFADFIAVPSDRVHVCPPHLSRAEAAALPLVGATAWRAVVTRGQVSRGDAVLVTGIGSGVAVAALQMAVARGATVVVTSSSADKIAAARAMGAAGGVLYTEPNLAKALLSALSAVHRTKDRFDAIIDGAAGPSLNAYLRVLKPGGALVSYGGTAGLCPDFSIFGLFLQEIQLKGTAMCSDKEFVEMLSFVSAHRIRPLVDSIYALNDIAGALDRMRAGEQMGKIVVDVAIPQDERRTFQLRTAKQAAAREALQSIPSKL